MTLRMYFVQIIPLLIAFHSTLLAAKETCAVEKQATLSLGYGSGLATVEAKINGQAVVMGLDTGAQTLVTPEAADSLKLLHDWRNRRIIGTTAVITVSNVILRDFEFSGDHRFGKSVSRASLKQLDWETKAGVKPLAGLIGMDVLADYDLDFDFPHRKLTLYKVRGCPSVAPIDYRQYLSLAFTQNAWRNALIPVKVEDKVLTAVIDTGAMTHAITENGALRTGVSAEMLKADAAVEYAGIGAVVAKRPIHTFRTLKVGDETFASVKMSVLASPYGYRDVLLGQSYLFARRFWMSNAKRTLFVDTNSTPAQAAAAPKPSPYDSSKAVHYEGKTPSQEDLCKYFPQLRQLGKCFPGADPKAPGLPYRVGASPQAPAAKPNP